MSPKNEKPGKPARAFTDAPPPIQPSREPFVPTPDAQKREWKPRAKSQRSEIVEGIQIVQGTLTAATGVAVGINPTYALYGIVAKGALELLTFAVSKKWKK